MTQTILPAALNEPTEGIQQYKTLFSGTLLANKFLFALTVLANNLFLVKIQELGVDFTYTSNKNKNKMKNPHLMFKNWRV